MLRASRHARRRMRERWGPDLTPEQWDRIVHHARAGSYTKHPDLSVSVDRQCYLVPMGEPGGPVHFVPMVISFRFGIVITVLPPE